MNGVPATMHHKATAKRGMKHGAALEAVGQNMMGVEFPKFSNCTSEFRPIGTGKTG